MIKITAFIKLTKSLWRKEIVQTKSFRKIYGTCTIFMELFNQIKLMFYENTTKIIFERTNVFLPRKLSFNVRKNKSGYPQSSCGVYRKRQKPENL